MTKNDWKKIKYFSMKEKFGDPLKMDLNHMITLDAFRNTLELKYPGKYSMIITEGWNNAGHVKKSQHYLGKAIDGYLKLKETGERENLKLTYNHILDFEEATKYISFTGIGLYRMSKYSQYIHLDTRNESRIDTWGGLPNRFENLHLDDSWLLLVYSIYGKDWDKFKISGKMKYVPLDYRFFKIVEDKFWNET